MTDILIRDVPEGIVGAIDRRAQRLGLSRTEYLRRSLARDAALADDPVTVEDLRQFAERFADLDDDETMRRAWE